MKAKAYCVLAFLLLLFGTSSVAQTKKRLTRVEAIQRFEEIVIENGYTNLPPTEDKSKLFPEPVFGGIDAEALNIRHDTLERKPFEVTSGNRFFKDGWAAFFQYKHPDQSHRRNLGRLIYMDAFGENMRIEHQDIYFVGHKRNRKRKRHQ